MKKNQQPNEKIFFFDGPFDGAEYTGNWPRPRQKYGVWDVEEEVLNGAMIQLVRHVYEFVHGQKRMLKFYRTEKGPIKMAEKHSKRRKM